MDDTLVTIPGATAHHVLGQSSVTLGAGDLNLLPASAGSKHDLMLTVGSAGFSLHHDTTFGTLEGDSRAYVFSPEIEGVKGGFVKITLPEGVEEDNSRLSALQTKFEQVLIAHGLLQPGLGDPSKGQGTGEHIALGAGEPLVTIPRCIAAQVLGEEIAILSEGTLSVVVVAPQSGTEEEPEPVLTLTVGKSAFLLSKDALFGTLANDPRTYVFKPVSEGTSEGFVAIVLQEPEPDAADADGAPPNSDVTSLQDDLEVILVEHGLLKDGLGAAADEVSRSFLEASAQSRMAQRICALRLLSASHGLASVASGAEKGMQSLADTAHGMGGAVLGAAFVAGAVVANALMPPETESSEPPIASTRTTYQVGEVVGEMKDQSQAAEDDPARNVRDVRVDAEGNAGRGVDAPHPTI